MLAPPEQKATQKACGPFTNLERHFEKNLDGRFCGRRLPRLNPCWFEEGSTYCLPHFFIIGEMKCGTTTLYHMLSKHPRMALPRVKEPRFLQPGRFAVTTVSRYAYNFLSAARSSDAVTFDASPIYLRSQVARIWLRRWLPDTRIMALVRNPAQRAYVRRARSARPLGESCPCPWARLDLWR